MGSYAVMLAILCGLGLTLRLGWPFSAGLAVAGALVLTHWKLIRTRTREGCFKAFQRSHWIGAAIFAGIAFGTTEEWRWH